MKFNKAFTLIELSISLIIITILVGLITTGVAIVQGAENRKVIADFNIYKTAINNFKLQYNQLPGDFNNAYAYWASQCGSTSCNGNGNGYIEYVSSNLDNDESLRAWQHLAASNYIPGSYTGNRSAAGANTIGANVPNSQIISAGWAFYQYQAYTNNLVNSLIFGATKSGALNDSPVLTTRSAFDIDSKIDDGAARTGYVLGLYSDDTLGNYGTGSATSSACAQTSTINNNDIANNGYYYINNDDGQTRCSLQFML